MQIVDGQHEPLFVTDGVDQIGERQNPATQRIIPDGRIGHAGGAGEVRHERRREGEQGGHRGRCHASRSRQLGDGGRHVTDESVRDFAITRLPTELHDRRSARLQTCHGVAQQACLAEAGGRTHV